MADFLVGFAALALFIVVAGELGDLRLRRRLIDAGRSRMPIRERPRGKLTRLT
jgi:hypothetical protein